MEFSSKYKKWLIVVAALLILLATFVSGGIFGSKLFNSDSSKHAKMESCDYDIVGSGEPVLNRNWRELHLGMTKSEVESTLDSIAPFFEYQYCSGSFNKEYLELADPDNGFEEYIPTRIYFYKDKIYKIISFTNLPKNGRSEIVGNNLRTKYANLDSLEYSNDTNSLGAIKRKNKGIRLPLFLRDHDKDRLFSLRDGHTVINIFDANEYGICVVMYDRLSHCSEDLDSVRQKRL